MEIISFLKGYLLSGFAPLKYWEYSMERPLQAKMQVKILNRPTREKSLVGLLL